MQGVEVTNTNIIVCWLTLPKIKPMIYHIQEHVNHNATDTVKINDFTKVQTMIYHTQEQHVNHNGYRHGQNKLKVYVIIDYLFKNVSTIFCQLVYIKTIFRKPTSHNMNLH